MLYLADKYGQSFFVYLHSLLINERELSFKMVIEKNLYTSLNIDEVAFLCNMSLSTFKRKFLQLYQESPGKWFQVKRLNKAKNYCLIMKRHHPKSIWTSVMTAYQILAQPLKMNLVTVQKHYENLTFFHKFLS